MLPFAAFKANVNASVLQHLADVTVRLGGDDVPGIFRKPSSVAALGVGAADTSPTVQIASDAVPADPAGQIIEIDGVPYAVINDAPDGTGMTMLTLEIA